MATFWVSSSGTGDGSSFSTPDDWAGAITWINGTATKGDIVNIIADGTHTVPLAGGTTITNTDLDGTDYDTDPGLVIRGVADALETPALATFAGQTASGRWLSINSSGVNYITVEGINWNYITVDPANGASIFYLSNASCGPIRVRYFSFTGYADDDVTNQGDAVRRFFDAGAIAPANYGEAAYGLFRNCSSPIEDNTALSLLIHHCVFWTKGIYSGTYSNRVNYTNTANSANVNKFYNNTSYINVSDDMAYMLEVSPASGDYGEVSVYNNVLWFETLSASGTKLTNYLGGSSGSTATGEGTRGYNVLYTGPSVAAGAIAGYYEDPWDGGADPKTTDHVATETAAATLFNAPTTSYSWDANGSGYTLTIPGDLRLLLHETDGLTGSLPGALPSLSIEEDGDDDDSVDDPDDPAAVPYLDVLPFFTDALSLDFNEKLRTAKNRVRQHYLRQDLEEKGWREFATRHYTLSTSTHKTVTSGIEVGSYVMMESDNAVQLCAGATPGIYLPAATLVVVQGGSYDYVQINNNSTTNTANVLITEVD